MELNLAQTMVLKELIGLYLAKVNIALTNVGR